MPSADTSSNSPMHPSSLQRQITEICNHQKERRYLGFHVERLQARHVFDGSHDVERAKKEASADLVERKVGELGYRLFEQSQIVAIPIGLNVTKYLRKR